MPDRPPKAERKDTEIIGMLCVIMVACGFIVGTLMFHTASVSSKLSSIQFKLSSMERKLNDASRN